MGSLKDAMVQSGLVSRDQVDRAEREAQERQEAERREAKKRRRQAAKRRALDELPPGLRRLVQAAKDERAAVNRAITVAEKTLGELSAEARRELRRLPLFDAMMLLGPATIPVSYTHLTLPTN